MKKIKNWICRKLNLEYWTFLLICLRKSQNKNLVWGTYTESMVAKVKEACFCIFKRFHMYFCNEHNHKNEGRFSTPKWWGWHCYVHCKRWMGLARYVRKLYRRLENISSHFYIFASICISFKKSFRFVSFN